MLMSRQTERGLQRVPREWPWLEKQATSLIVDALVRGDGDDEVESAVVDGGENAGV